MVVIYSITQPGHFLMLVSGWMPKVGTPGRHFPSGGGLVDLAYEADFCLSVERAEVQSSFRNRELCMIISDIIRG